MSTLLDLFSIVAISAGTFFFFAGTVAFSLSDSLTRLHALTKADTLGLGLVTLGLIPRADGALSSLRLIVIWALVLLSGASTSQLIGRVLKTRSQMSVLPYLDILLASVVIGVAIFTIAARDLFASRGRLRRLRVAARFRLDPPLMRRTLP